MAMQPNLEDIYHRLGLIEQMLARHFGEQRGSRTPPKDFSPDPIRERMVKVKPGVDRDFEFQMFMAHEFPNPKTDWNRAWFQWLSRATPRKPSYEDARKTTTSYEESRHPAIVAERNRTNELRRFGQ